ncbi:MAG: alpha/beta hydrolase [Sedimentisphaerales bacterium]|jgi:acetyl esterase/lipase|nr:alpha/beta hydrolase [Sedimentisphaerales bacterium]HNY77564.1 alpha/beta hydrolase [Sedimentisphaerales bacterium]HOC61897.1 alpha/beta hydrolase [Sedimentisphaerales bacterium]HOH63739.1 alpha/beta hydrolase [Sedimentisphaerales bacterium]HPY48348.1 alpha/beta hydrolase [Sedimentisphaerales bacterium]
MNGHTRTLVGFSLLALLLAMFPAACIAAEPSVTVLWPAGAPGAKGAADGDIPKLTIYLPDKDKATGAAIVICPGGGYGHLAMDHEGHQIAQWLNSFGVAGFILQYRHRNSGAGYGHPAPLQDVQRAIRTVRSGADRWSVKPDRIGVLGFSAGGHLASTAVTHFDDKVYDPRDEIDQAGARPDFGVLIYPVISFVEPFTHVGSRQNLLGADAGKELMEKFSNERQVTAQTPPCFLIHTWEDTGVPAENSVYFCLAMRKAKVPVEMHLFAKGPHGFGLGQKIEGTSAWPTLCQNWMKVSGFLGK